MAKKQSQTVKGCRKCGRSKRKAAGTTTPIALFVRGKMTAENYFKATGQKAKV